MADVQRLLNQENRVITEPRQKVGGMMLGYSCVACLGLFGIFFVFSSTIMLATANYDDDFWDHFDRDNDPTVTVGSILLVVGRK
ncbi:hypothetical protein GWK47_002777 [Chionoecetes opilio]|uniref:Uncharacterized protein n=1 Tax=Chionoecetes opilio TaxID=41210 RepID=A0A8J4XPJ9_CHIOP|nr:hypothetical protein GWK47_002777 [Chionoecetes opilio]